MSIACLGEEVKVIWILNTHNYTDFLHLDQTQRITQIANVQKGITARYHACLMATAEYRKNIPKDPKKMLLPVDDDLADARALMYRPNVIFHVYNDLHDRKEHAEIFGIGDDGKAAPRLLLHFTKNKISSFKDKLVLDMDTKSVTLSEVSESQAHQDAHEYSEAREAGNARMEGQKVIWVDSNYEED